MKRAVLAAVFVATLSPTQAAAETQDWITVRNREFSFRFIHPADWRVRTPRGLNVRYLISTPASTPLGSCNIVVRRVPKLADYSQRRLDDELAIPYDAKDWADLMDGKFPDLRVIESRGAKADNRPAQYAVLEFSYETVERKIYTRSMNVVTLSPGVFWHFSCGAGGPTPPDALNSYMHWSRTFGRILSSLVFEQ
jgi:hypothetical protein